MVDFPTGVTATDPTYLLGANATDPAKAAVTAAGLAILDDADAAAQRTTLGLGTAAVAATGDFDAAGAAASAQSAAIAASCQRASNLSDVASAATSRTNLGATTVGAGVFTAADRQTAAVLLGIIMAGATESRSANFNVDSAKPGAYYKVTVGGTAGTDTVTATLPALAAGDDGFVVTVSKTDSSAGTLVVTDGTLTLRLVLQYEAVTVRWNGSAWRLVAKPDAIRSIYCGTGADGDVAVTGSVSLTQDMHYRNLTISGAGAITTQGRAIFVQETLDLLNASASAIHNNGNAGTAGSGTAAGPAGAATLGRFLSSGGSAVAGAAGGTGAGAQATAVSVFSGAYGGQANASGAGGSGSGGAGGSSRAATAVGSAIVWRTLQPYGTSSITSAPGSGTTAVPVGGGHSGQGGSSGGGDGTNSGGGGGGNGKGPGVVFVACAKLLTGGSTAANAIASNGGNGGNGGTPPTGNCGGGGGSGGGSGGLVALIYGERVGTPLSLISANAGAGGTGGNGVGTGNGGNGGASGSPGQLASCNFTTGVWSAHSTSAGSSTTNAGSAASGGTGGAGGAAITAQGTV